MANGDRVLAGRDLDAAVAERVMGLGADGRAFQILPYSTEWQHAGAVVERLAEIGWLVVVKVIPEGHPFLAGNDWTIDPKVYKRSYCSLSWPSTDHRLETQRRFWGRHPDGVGDSGPQAICRAALEAMEVG